MSTALHVELTESHDRTAVITVAGDLDLGTAPDFYQRTTAALERHPVLVLDLARLTFCDSSGFNALLRLRRRTQEAGGEVVLAAPPDHLLRLLTLTGAEAVFPVHGSLAAALASAGDGASDAD
ncbi:STAS domain-containing protein [Actinacidiphila alni]|uniref:STAS domain-containing protein n=1 Tax=Actinacidiphila alni TaxID=380248 RepID=UPI0033D606AB